MRRCEPSRSSAHHGVPVEAWYRNFGSGPYKGGGERITADLSSVTQYRLHDALGEPAISALGNRNETPECLVEPAVNTALDQSYAQVEALLLGRFSEITLSDLTADFPVRNAARSASLPACAKIALTKSVKHHRSVLTPNMPATLPLTKHVRLLLRPRAKERSMQAGVSQ